MKTLFDTQTYLDAIHFKIEQNFNARGYQTKLAKAAGCQPSYFSQILHGRAFLTPDQASSLADFWQLDPTETEYFFTLVHLARAGTNSLRKKLSERVQKIMIDKKANLDRSLIVNKPNEGISLEDYNYYCQNWFCPAIRVLLRNRSYRTAKAIAEYLHLSVDLVKDVLNRFERMGIASHFESEWNLSHLAMPEASESDKAMEHLAIQDRARFKNSAQLQDNFRSNWIGMVSEDSFAELKSLIRNFVNDQKRVAETEVDESLLVGLSCDLFHY